MPPESAPICAAGTFRAGGPSVAAQLGALLKFGWIFTAQLAQAYLRKRR